MLGLKNQARTLLRNFGLAPRDTDILEAIARAIPILSIFLTAILSLNTISSGAPISSPTAAQLTTDIGVKINYERNQNGAIAIDRTVEADAKALEIAQRNASAQSELPVDDPEGNLVVLQINKPYSEANAETLINAFLNSPEHREVLMGSDYTSMGVGVEIHGDRVWTVVQFTLT